MKAIRSLSTVLTLCAALFAPALADAQGLFRAYLKSTGSDANPCTVAAPCRLLPTALSAVASGGEIWILDSANFNTSTVTVGKSVTILAIPGATGSVIATGGAQAISINAPGVQVALRNLVILPGPGAGTSGITMTAGDRLSVERCLIHGLVSGAAVHVSTGARVEVTDSILRNNGNGVLAENLASIDIASSKIVGNSGHGVFVNALAAGTTTATISDTILSDNSVGARALASASGAVGRIYANRVTAAKNTTVGLASEATGSGVAILSVGNSLVDKNATGILQSGASASVRSLGDNSVADNGTDVIGTLTALAPR